MSGNSKQENKFIVRDLKGVSDLKSFIKNHRYESSQIISQVNSTKNREAKKKILLIDDDVEMIEIGGNIISSAGFDFISSTSGQQGLDFVLKYKPDLILLDYMMPKMDGLQVFEKLTTNQEYRLHSGTPVIMLTAKSELDIDRTSLFEMGLAAFLVKPFGHRELVNVIENVFTLHQVKLKNKELEQKIRRSEYKYQDLIENANDLIYTLDLNGDFIFINRQLSTLTGFSREDWNGRSFFDLVAPEDRVEARANFNKTLKGKARIFEIRLICQTGSPLFISMNINPIYEKGTVVGAVGISRDITQRKKLEQQIIDLKNFNESIIQSMGSGLITLNLERRITSFNNSAEEILGYKQSEILGKNLDEIFPEEAGHRLIQTNDSNYQSPLDREIELNRKDGSKIFIGYSVSSRIDNHNLKVGTIISFRDISQIKQMQMEVVRMDRLASMGVLASGIAHEVRNPLAGIKTMAQTLEEEMEVSDARREYLTRIISQVNRLDELLKSLFSFAKPQQLVRKYQQLEDIFNEVDVLFEERFKKKGIKYLKEYQPNLPKVYVDFHQIQQVFINLYLNSFDAMKEGGTFSVLARRVETAIYPRDRRKKTYVSQKKELTYVEVLIKDTGTGISQEDKKAIFDPFFTTKPQGIGLGLSIVYRIIEEHQGEIRFVSELGEGTEFTLLLPTEEE